jgi:hypothetical protein
MTTLSEIARREDRLRAIGHQRVIVYVNIDIHI